MTTNHIDQLSKWWENAEKGTPNAGDTIIWRKRDDDFAIYQADSGEDQPDSSLRILARAPKPKPAWHDAKVVIASTDYCERQVWERDTTYENRWYGTAGDGAVTRDLRDVTPLIEAKVTDEMVERGYYAENTAPDGLSGPQYVRRILTAALGLETE